MGTVYVVQESPGKNIAGAMGFGTLQVLLSYHEQIAFSSEKAVAELREKLRGFGNEDYVLPIGDPAAIAIACMVASEVNKGLVKLLKWDRQEMKYYPVQIDLHPDLARARKGVACGVPKP